MFVSKKKKGFDRLLNEYKKIFHAFLMIDMRETLTFWKRLHLGGYPTVYWLPAEGSIVFLNRAPPVYIVIFPSKELFTMGL